MATILGNDLTDDSLAGGSGNDLVQGMGGNDTLIGRGGSDTLEGGNGDDVLNGGSGANVLVGGDGNDTYEVNSLADVVAENAGEGADRVRSWASGIVLAGNVEDLELLGTAGTGYGNELDNQLFGNAAANTLIGDIGQDRIEGRAGADLLAGGIGNDSLYGGSENDTLQGEDGYDRLDGGAGADVLIGAAGNDIYVVDSAGDVIDESTGDGQDLVFASINYTLGSLLENLEITGTAQKATGNAAVNILVGNGSANVLRGGGGADSLYGNDGNDTLYGDAGADTLEGGNGTDVYQVVRGGGQDVIVDAGTGTQDIVRFSGTNVTCQQLWFTRDGNDLLLRVLATTGTVRVVDFFLNTDHDWLFQLADGGHLSRVDVEALETAMAPLAVPSTTVIPATGDYAFLPALVQGTWYNDAPTDIALSAALVAEGAAAGTVVGTVSGTDPDAGDTLSFTLVDDAGGRFVLVGNELRVASGAVFDYETATSHAVTLRATDSGGLHYVEVLDINVGDAVETVTGTSGDDLLVAGIGADVVQGLDGNDTLTGGGGGDTIDGGNGTDVAAYTGKQGGFIFTVASEFGTVVDMDSTDGSEGFDVLSGIESLRFAGNVVMTANGSGASITGGSGSDLLVGTNGHDQVTGSATGGADTLVGGWGNDTLNGDSNDVIRYAGSHTGYSITKTASTWTITDTNTVDGDDGTDTLNYTFREIEFGDGWVQRGAKDVRVNSYYPGPQMYSNSAALADGGYVVAWQADSQSGGAYFDVYAQQFTASGARVGGTVRLNQYYVDNQVEVAVVGLANGGYVASWMSYGQDGSNWGIYGRDSRVAGEFLWAFYTGGEQYYPALAAGADGGYALAWWSNGYMTVGTFNSSGASLINSVVVSGNTYGSAFPSITALTDGHYVVAWQANGNAADIRLRWFDRDGNFLTGEIQANVNTSSHDYYPQVKALADGASVVVWQKDLGSGSGPYFDVYFRIFNASGTAVTGDIKVNGAAALVHAEAATLSDGRFVVSWVSAQDTGGVAGVYARIYSSSGVAQTGEIHIDVPGGNATSMPSVAAAGDGGFVVTWDQDGSDVFSQQYNASGQPVGTLMLAHAGTAGDDTLVGGSDDDLFRSDAGNDVFQGGTGYDVVRYAGQQGDYGIASGASGFSSVTDNSTLDGSAGTDSLASIERVEFDNGVYVLAAGGNLEIHGSSGGDRMTGSTGNDVFYVSGMNDTVEGGTGGLDTLVMEGTFTLDLSVLPDAVVHDVERIDLRHNSGLKVGLSDVLNMSTASDTLQVIGDAGNTVYVQAGFTNAQPAGPWYQDGYAFTKYTNGSATLLIEQGITVQGY